MTRVAGSTARQPHDRPVDARAGSLEQLRGSRSRVHGRPAAFERRFKHDAVALIEDGARFSDFLIDIGDADPFLKEQLRPELLERACAKANIPLKLRSHSGYDHSYYFISTFMEDHLRWHAARLDRSGR